MPKQSLVEKFTNKHPNKDFYNAVKECFTGSWDSFSDNFKAKYEISVGSQTLRKYLEEGIEKGDISVKLPKAQKRGKESLEDKFKVENPDKNFNEALKECFDGSLESLGKNLKKKYKVRVLCKLISLSLSCQKVDLGKIVLKTKRLKVRSTRRTRRTM